MDRSQEEDMKQGCEKSQRTISGVPLQAERVHHHKGNNREGYHEAAPYYITIQVELHCHYEVCENIKQLKMVINI